MPELWADVESARQLADDATAAGDYRAAEEWSRLATHFSREYGEWLADAVGE